METLLLSIEDDVIISVLLNGGESPWLRELFSKHECIKYYESPINLGVAGGRNHLLKTEESRNSDIIMILDNDIVPPVDYVKNMASFLIKHKDVAVVGPAMADMRHITYSAVKHHGEKGVFGNRIFKIKSKNIKRYILAEFTPDRVYHIGTHPNFFYAYFSIRPYFYNVIDTFFSALGFNINRSPFLKNNTKYYRLLHDGSDKISVTNVGGGTQTFRRSLVEEIGDYDNKFNPFGYEDVEFCTRALKAGYKNYIDLNTWIYHGTDDRQRKRDPLKLLKNRFRCLTHYAASAIPGRFTQKEVMLKLIMFETFFDVIRPNEDVAKNIKARLDGYKTALQEQSKETL
ncbi:MAG: glycosyltransferase family 2 protein [Desulfobacteraceae bacterium]|nr:glycosyltransferase family 2 protein [Desulfobacteraceae bacterium]